MKGMHKNWHRMAVLGHVILGHTALGLLAKTHSVPNDEFASSRILFQNARKYLIDFT